MSSRCAERKMSKQCVKILAAVAAALSMLSCAEKDYPAERVISVAFLKSLYKGYPLTVTENLRLRLRVVSTDRFGNFYHTLAAQDATGGIMLYIACDELYKSYPQGDSIEVACRSLTLGAYGGNISLGGAPEGSYEFSALSRAQAAEHVTSFGMPASAVVPLRCRIAELSAAAAGKLVTVSGVRFVEGGERWAENGAATTRTLVDDASPSDSLLIRTSPYAEFASRPLPRGVCDASGVLGYFGGRYQLIIDSPDSVSAEN